ncbi:MAG: SAM-dependent methyltransferase, partial [Erysipelotrichia bacterium]|nr:SAM-dependent methyltransferase [Erysipelotrichia bacterium]
AKKNIEYYKMSDCITTCLSDGLAALQDDVNCVVIAGMGFETIQSILNNHLEKLHANRTFIIQANKDVEQLRRWISAHHFQMIKEMVVKEDKHYYQILAFRCCEGDVLSEQEIRFGKKMKKDFTFYSLWKYRLSRYEAILRTLDENNPRYKQVFTEMMYIYQEFGS